MSKLDLRALAAELCPFEHDIVDGDECPDCAPILAALQRVDSAAREETWGEAEAAFQTFIAERTKDAIAYREAGEEEDACYEEHAANVARRLHVDIARARAEAAKKETTNAR